MEIDEVALGNWCLWSKFVVCVARIFISEWKQSISKSVLKARISVFGLICSHGWIAWKKSHEKTKIMNSAILDVIILKPICRHSIKSDSKKSSSTPHWADNLCVFSFLHVDICYSKTQPNCFSKMTSVECSKVKKRVPIMISVLHTSHFWLLKSVFPYLFILPEKKRAFRCMYH